MTPKPILVRVRTRFFARVLDFVLVSIPNLTIALIINFTIGWSRSWIVFLLLATQFIWFIIYFIIIPVWAQGATLAKKIFQIQIISTTKHKKNLIIGIIARELFLVLLPWIFNLGIGLSLELGLKNFSFDNVSEWPQWAQILSKIGPSFLALWYLSIIAYVKLNKDHQVFFDYRYSLLVVRKKVHHFKSKNAANHEHLAGGPGVVSDPALQSVGIKTKIVTC